MTTIDHRILIPVPQNVVWDYLGNLTNNARWQVDCNNLSFLTSRHEGVGTRWRASSEKGKEYVVEIRAWYEGLGYEYAFIDRPPFRTAIGRIRLQEIPEGTVVQWTIEYEIGGMFAMRTARQLDNDVAQSLKKLYLTLKTDRARIIDPNPVAKSLMRDAPDAEARAQYKARHPSQVEERAEEREEEAAAPIERVEITGIEEPPLTADDTRPTRAVTAISDEMLASSPEPAAEASEPAEALSEPAFLADVPAEIEDKRATQEHQVISEAPSPSPSPSEQETVTGEPLSHAQMIDVGAIERELDESTLVGETLVTTESTTVGGPVIPEPPLGGTDSERMMDTSKISIWEIFGVPRPSEETSAAPEETQPPEVETVTALPPVAPEKPRAPKKAARSEAPAPDAVADIAAPALDDVLVHTRVGLRLKLRRRLVHLRRWN
ncbi:MAG: SRPBCC family protein [Anaerolineae bacterium]|nr:SRPBCC family protein [Anaerolineae bacterium]